MALRTLPLLVVISLLALPLTASPATIHVPGDQPTIQQGLYAAGAGDTVLVAAGTYTDTGNRDLDFHGVNIALVSEDGYMSTFIDCGSVARGFVFSSGEDTTSVVRGFTIEHAFADTGAGAICINGSSPRFEDCVFQLNSVSDIGGGVACTRASHPIFRDCTFAVNMATGGASARGGAIACIGGSAPVFGGCSISGNTAANFGGGAYCHNSSPTFRSCTFMYNESTVQGGGGIFTVSLSSPVVESCSFIGNTSGADGGAIYGQSSPVSVSDCLFYLNESANAGGAISFLYSQSIGQFTDCTFIGNYSSLGGVLYCFSDANLTFGNCTFDSNSASVDGALVVANSASPVFERSIVANSEGDPLIYCGGTADPVFFRCVVFGNDPGDDLCGSVSDTLHRNPLFCDPAGIDWSLCEDSVCDGANNAWGELIGSKPVGCGACGSAVEPTTWGSIKAMYR